MVTLCEAKQCGCFLPRCGIEDPTVLCLHWLHPAHIPTGFSCQRFTVTVIRVQTLIEEFIIDFQYMSFVVFRLQNNKLGTNPHH